MVANLRKEKKKNFQRFLDYGSSNEVEVATYVNDFDSTRKM